MLAEVTDSFIEAGGCGVAEVFAKIFELSFSAGAFGDGFGKPAFIHGAGGLLDVCASFLHLLLDLLLILGVSRFAVLWGFGLLHAIVEFVDVAEHIALFIPESFEFAFEFFAFLIGAGGAQFGFELFESFIDHLLAAGEFSQSIEDLELLALLAVGFLLLLGLAFGFVAIAVVVQLQLLELLLRGAVSATSSTSLLLLLLLLLDLEFGGAHFEECLQGALFGGESCAGFGGRIAGGCFEQFSGVLHVGCSAFSEGSYLGSLRGVLECLLELFECLPLRLGDCREIFRQGS